MERYSGKRQPLWRGAEMDACGGEYDGAIWAVVFRLAGRDGEEDVGVALSAAEREPGCRYGKERREGSDGVLGDEHRGVDYPCGELAQPTSRTAVPSLHTAVPALRLTSLII